MKYDVRNICSNNAVLVIGDGQHEDFLIQENSKLDIEYLADIVQVIQN